MATSTFASGGSRSRARVDYNVTAGGEVNGYIRPQLTFGAGSSVSGILIPLAIAFALLAALTLVALVVAGAKSTARSWS